MDIDDFGLTTLRGLVLQLNSEVKTLRTKFCLGERDSVSIEMAAFMANVSTNTIRCLVRESKIMVLFSGGDIKIPVSELQRWLSENPNGPQAQCSEVKPDAN